MVILSENDYLDVKVNSLIADYDFETVSNLYQPIIGYGALAIYFTLIAEAKNQKISSLTSHHQILNRLQMAPGDFADARKKLEGVGLLRTILEKSQNIKIYHYLIFAPKTPYDFFDDTLLYGMLIKAVGDVDANRFKVIYQFTNTVSNGKDISSSFLDAYQPNFDDPAFMKALTGADAIGRRNGKINSEFSYDRFFESLSQISQISQEAFTKKDMKEIERLATLNGVSEADAASAVAKVFDPYSGKGKHVDFIELTKIFQEHTDYSYLLKKKSGNNKNTNSGNTVLAGKINIMETRSPKEFLALLQNGSQPAMSDLRIVDDLSKKFHLNNGVINAIVDYVLTTNNNVLSRAFCEKIAASIAREGITTTIDVMNYIVKVSKGRKKDNSSLERKSEKTNEQQETKTNKKEKESSINWDDLLDDLDSDEGDENGKA